MVTPVLGDIPSPKAQVESGVAPENVVCKDGYVLMLRPSGAAACVMPATAEHFKELDWEQITLPKAVSTVPKLKVQTATNEIENVPASQGSVVNFYVNDHDLNTNHKGVDVIDTQGLLEFTINGVTISGPDTMIETGTDTGRFYVKLNLPNTINGQPLSNSDIIEIRYLDQSDAAGEKRVLVKSIELTKTFAQVSSYGGGSRIGHEFTIRVYEPDANLDSKDTDTIPLSSFIFEAEGGIETTLANPKFDANRPYLAETGPNTSTFEVKIKIPREIDGKVIHIGDRYEIKYIDRSTPSETSEEIILKGRIG
ncbi:MAG: hypothetical protein R3327_01245 [Nitrosopumilaceae archaeon]|nr:hypothetical protein [Nitrosopumilaceae archaeon]